MLRAKRWKVDVFIDEHDEYTYAEARLIGESDMPLVGRGRARLSPTDEDVPEIGDELAVARALNDLGHRLLLATATDIGDLRHEQIILNQ